MVSTDSRIDLLDQVLAVYSSPQVTDLGDRVDRATADLTSDPVTNVQQFHQCLRSWASLLRGQGVGIPAALDHDTAAVTAWVDRSYNGVTGGFVGALIDTLVPQVGLEAVVRCLADTLKAQLSASHIQVGLLMDCGLHDWRQQQRLVEQIVNRWGRYLSPSVAEVPIPYLARSWRDLLESVMEAESQFRRKVRGEPMSI